MQATCDFRASRRCVFKHYGPMKTWVGTEVLEEPISSFFQAVRTETAINMDKAGTGEKYRTYSHDITAHKTVLTNVSNHFKNIADTKVVAFPAV